MPYKFIQNNDSFSWVNDKEAKIEFSNPRIQTHNNIVNLTNPAGILYYYYDVKVSMKSWNNRWNTILSISPYDFPAILALQKCLNAAVSNNPDDPDEFNLSACIQEDSYTLSKDGREDTQWHNFTIGKTSECNMNVTQSVTLKYLDANDIVELQKCVNAFIKYSMELYSEERNKTVDFWRTNKEVKNGNLYVYKNDRDGEPYLDAIYTSGDKFDSLDYLVEDNGTYIEQPCHNVVMESVDPENMILYATDGREFDLDKIMYFFYAPTKEKLGYDVEEIVDDFVKILSDDEKKEFKVNSDNELFEKYKEAILDRTWMCRDEHKFEERYPELLNIEDTGNHERVYEVIKWVIKELHQKFSVM